MIPLRLGLKNFMSYRDQTEPIDFGPIHVACLSGENGAGKSALLTAMTWALWGEAPAHADDEDLIAQGESEMSVDFEFTLGDLTYRVLRSRSRKGRTTTGKLYFEVLDGVVGWRSIGGDTARHTQRLITERLRMDYATFVNSAFLRQGHADEFTTKSPTDRKDILSRILGLEEYDALNERARETARSCDGDRRQLAAGIAELDKQILQKAELQKKAAEIAAYLKDARETLATAKTDAERLRLLVAAAEKDKTELDNARARASQHEVEITKAERAIAALDANLLRYQETLAGREEIAANYARLVALRGRERELAELAQRSHEVEGEINRSERAIDGAKNVLANEIAMLKRGIAEKRKTVEKGEKAEEQLAEVRRQLAEYDALQAEREAAQVEHDAWQQAIATLTGANEKLEAEAKSLKEKLTRLNDGIAAAEAQRRSGQELCPLCGMMLDPDALARVRASLDADIEERRGQWRANNTEAEKLKKQAAATAARSAELDLRLKARTMAEKREAALEREQQAATEAREGSEREAAELQAVEVRLELGDYAMKERAELTATQARLRALAYSPEEHKRVTAEARALEPYEKRNADLRSAAEKLESDSERLAGERDRLELHRARLAGERADETRLAAAVADLTDKRRESAEREVMLRKEGERFDLLSREQAGLERQLEGIESAEIEREARAAELARATTEKGIYEELAKAFGKGGIQAMVIEQVVPELSEEANKLLGRMTDNRMQLTFETQRPAKSKDSTIETLELKITDGTGVARKYEMFSGGEAFRINFAVRIALSKLLARRAGAQLQTLIIDEGFGTQDAQGRERLVQAIRSIQGDFEKILVITHIDEIKDEFASRIDVVKTARGSLATVS
ncbi:MAG: AAA family ATPase [Chloroflexia bacterium]